MILEGKISLQQILDLEIGENVPVKNIMDGHHSIEQIIRDPRLQKKFLVRDLIKELKKFSNDEDNEVLLSKGDSVLLKKYDTPFDHLTNTNLEELFQKFGGSSCRHVNLSNETAESLLIIRNNLSLVISNVSSIEPKTKESDRILKNLQEYDKFFKGGDKKFNKEYAAGKKIAAKDQKANKKKDDELVEQERLELEQRFRAIEERKKQLLREEIVKRVYTSFKTFENSVLEIFSIEITAKIANVSDTCYNDSDTLQSYFLNYQKK